LKKSPGQGCLLLVAVRGMDIKNGPDDILKGENKIINRKFNIKNVYDRREFEKKTKNKAQESFKKEKKPRKI